MWDSPLKWTVPSKRLVCGVLILFRSPVDDSEALERREIFWVRGDYGKSIREGYRRDLTVDEWRCFTKLFKPPSLVRVPLGRSLIIRERRNRWQNHLLKKVRQLLPSLPTRQPTHPESQLMPAHASHRTASSIFAQKSQHSLVGTLPDR